MLRYSQFAIRNSQLISQVFFANTPFLASWVLVMIAIPLMRWVIGDLYLPVGVMAGVILQSCTVLTMLQAAWGSKAIVRLAALIVPITWLIEYIGSSTGVPFGRYHYTTALQPQLGGVPIIIPLAWLMMLPPCWAVASQLKTDNCQLSIVNWRFSALAGLAMTAWDLFLDPQMVAWGYWVWDGYALGTGGYFGIPWVNFAGWWLSATLVTALVQWIVQPPTLPVGPLLLIYAITWLLQTIGQAFFWGQPGPALCGFVAMGVMLGLALRSSKG